MAVINNLKVKFTSFKIDDVESKLLNNIGTYGTTDILNGGELLDHELIYTFTISGLKEHTIKSISTKSLLLTDSGDLNTTKNISLYFKEYGNKFTGNLITSDSVKTIVSTEFNSPYLVEDDQITLTLVVDMNSDKSCYYGLSGLVIELQDIDYSIQINFSGTNTDRSPSSIIVAYLLLNKNAESVTFSKDPTNNFDASIDTVEGRVYFRKDGIYVDGYLYGTVAGATGIKAGIVKIKDSFDTFTETNEETGEITTGIVAPTDSGIAASTIMVFNAINTLKTYTDELIDGIPVPSIELDDNTVEEIKDNYTFSNDFKKDEGKIYINWLEI